VRPRVAPLTSAAVHVVPGPLQVDAQRRQAGLRADDAARHESRVAAELAKTVLMPIGLPAIGKTSLMLHLARDTDYLHLSSDAIRAEVTGSAHDFTRERDVWQRFDAELRHGLTSDREPGTVIADATWLTTQHRAPCLRLLRGFRGVTLKVYEFPPDAALACQREGHRRKTMGGRGVPFAEIRRMATRYVPFDAREAVGIAMRHYRVEP
jgi:hypothetical protein